MVGSIIYPLVGYIIKQTGSGGTGSGMTPGLHGGGQPMRLFRGFIVTILKPGCTFMMMQAM